MIAEAPTPLENLTLAEALARFVRAPGVTWRAFVELARSPAEKQPPETVIVKPATTFLTSPLSQTAPSIEMPSLSVTPLSEEQRIREAVRLSLWLVALVIALVGTSLMATQRRDGIGLQQGAIFASVAFAFWLAAEAYGRRARAISRVAVNEADTAPQPAIRKEPWDKALSGFILPRVVLAAMGAWCSLQVWNATSHNIFSTEGFWLWIASIMLWVAAFAPGIERIGASIPAVISAVRNFRPRLNGTVIALALIVLLGAIFRLSDLPGVPPEMTSDHVEKLLDAQRVLDGTHQIFFPNNGGREPFQMYAMALFSRLPGLGMNFTTLKLLSALEGIITLPVLWWMGREVAGKDDAKLGNLVGLALAALVAASYWHVALSRLALRIVLTPLVTALLIIYLSRAMRDNRRSDYIKAGLVLGFGLYTYQAVRILPVVVLIGVGLAIAFKARSLRTLGTYLTNLAVLIVIAGVVFVPLLHFWVEYPDDFWRRTSGRLLGDDVIQTTDEAGNLVQRTPTLDERWTAFGQNLPILLDNIGKALLMFNWKGDVAWINGAPNHPAMDPLTGALLLVGLAAWLARMVRRRDPVDWLLPVMLFIMLLPSALSIAYPVENPSATRTSGALPEAYLFAALPLALIMRASIRLAPGRRGAVLAAGAAGIVTLLAFGANADLYFGRDREEYVGSYLISSLPYSEIGRSLKGFAESGGSYGNAFMVAYPYWWDHRAIGIEAGLVDWPNGIVSRDQIVQFLWDASQRTDSYRFDPERDILFYYNYCVACPDDAKGDVETEALLKELFPTGYTQYVVSYQPEDSYAMFRVPRLGQQGFTRLMETALTGAG